MRETGSVEIRVLAGEKKARTEQRWVSTFEGSSFAAADQDLGDTTVFSSFPPQWFSIHSSSFDFRVPSIACSLALFFFFFCISEFSTYTRPGARASLGSLSRER